MEEKETITTENGKTIVTYVLFDETQATRINRLSGSGNDNNITGNETFTVSLLNNETPVLEGYPVKIGDDYYKVSYTKKQTKVDGKVDGKDITTITDYITLTKMDFDSMTYEDVLGPGVYYGIAVDTFHNTGHIQSNIAVNNYYGKGGEINPNLAKTEGGEGATGVIAAANILDNRMYLNIGDSDGFALVFVDPDDEQYVTDTGGGNMNGRTYYTVPTPSASISGGIVNPILNQGAAMSAELLTKETTFAPVPSDNGTVDLTCFPEDATIYLDGDDYASYLAQSQGLKFEMHENQMVVFNFDSTDHITIQKLLMTVNNQNKDEVWIAEHVVYNCASATTLDLIGTYGMFLAPRSDVDITIKNSSEGWIISNGTLRQQDYGCEWHLKSKKMKKDTTASTSFGKLVDGEPPLSFEVFEFPLYKWVENEDGSGDDTYWTLFDTLTNFGPSIKRDIKKEDGRIFRIEESGKKSTTDGEYSTDKNKYYVVIRFVGQINGPTSLGMAAYAEYYSTFEAAYDVYLNGNAASDASKAKRVPAIVFENTTVKGGLNITKKVEPEIDDDQVFTFTLQVWNNSPNTNNAEHPYAYTGNIKGTKGDEAWTATSTTTGSITIDGNTYGVGGLCKQESHSYPEGGRDAEHRQPACFGALCHHRNHARLAKLLQV